MRRRRLTAAACAALVLTIPACSDAPISEPPAEPTPDILARINRPGEGDAVHLVRLLQRGDSYAFEPDHLSIPTGDVVRFILTGGQPESVAFDTTAASPETVEFILDRSLHLGVLLVEPGQAYDVSFVGAPAGSYPFRSIPHAGRGMTGVVEVME